MLWLITLPFRIVFFFIKLILFIFLLCLGPFGWGIIAGWMYGKHNSQQERIATAIEESSRKK